MVYWSMKKLDVEAPLKTEPFLTGFTTKHIYTVTGCNAKVAPLICLSTIPSITSGT